MGDEAAPSATPTASSVHASVPIGAVKPKKRKAADTEDESMDDEEQLADAQAGVIRLTESGMPEPWLYLLPEGERRHPKGTLKFTPDFLQKLSDNFHNKVRVISPVIDTDHDRGIANGWVEDVRYLPGHGLDIKPDWTKLGEERVTGKLFKYLSAEFGPYTSERSGETFSPVLNCVSLTNLPYLKELPEVGLVTLSELGVFIFAERATSANKDPDHDGDDDSTAEGDTDDDYEGPDGNRKPKATLTDDNIDERFFLSVSVAERKQIPAGDFAGPHDSFPVDSQEHATSAWDLAGQADDPDAVRRRIKDIAGRKGYSLPATATKKDTTMNEHENQDSVQLADVVRRLGEIEQENTRLREENNATKRQLRETRLDAELMKLNESREITLSDHEGVTAKGMAQGFGPAVVAVARELILLSEANETPTLTLLRTIQESGMVPLGELGVSRTSNEHDPVQMPASATDGVDGAKLVEQAETFAKKTYGKSLTKLSDEERLGVFSAVGFRGEFS